MLVPVLVFPSDFLAESSAAEPRRISVGLFLYAIMLTKLGKLWFSRSYGLSAEYFSCIRGNIRPLLLVFHRGACN